MIAAAVLLGLAATTATPLYAAAEARNFDARIDDNRGLSISESAVQIEALERFRAEIPELAVSFDRATGVARTLYNRTGYLTAPNAGSAREIGQAFVRSNLDLLGLELADLDGLAVQDSVYSEATGATHIYLVQTQGGIPVYNGLLHFNINRTGRVISVNNSLVPGLASAINTLEPARTAAEAVGAIANHLGVATFGGVETLSEAVGARRFTILSAPDLSLEPIEAQLVLLPVRGDNVRLAWNFQVQTLDKQHWYDVTVDAASSKVWTRFDWTNSDSYRVYAVPAESPNHVTPLPPADGRTLVSDPANATASPLAWHDTGSNSYTIHRGNNVHAYDDANANNSPPGSEPSCGASLDCDFSIDLNQAPSNYRSAAITNLFYWNNIIHDVQYQYGFDEAGGNFQVNNFGNGGSGNDDVRAEAQDGGGTNNANFSTPTDGGRPRMQMFLWTAANPDIDGDLDNGIIAHEYGHGVSIRQVGGPGNSSCLNNTQQMGEGWSDFLGLWYSAESGDTGADPRGIGTYALDQPTDGPGIRTQRYSTSQSINNWTYETISTGVSIPHGVGAVWAQGIWEAYWSLVDTYGFDSDLYNAGGGAGNQRMMLYVNEGFKNTSCSPTFVDARDGIIQAATDNYGGADVCRLWEAFAAYGLGTDANDASSNSLNVDNGFAIPAECSCSPNPIADAGPDQSICQGDSATIGTAAQTGHSYSWAPGGQTSAQITVSPSSTTNYTVTATTACGSASDTVTVTVDNGSDGGLNDSFENGISGWTATGLWHEVSDSTCASPGYSSPIGAVYYGQDSSCNYDTGGANSGTFVSPVITGINSSSTLTFDYYRVVEDFNGDYDRTIVDILSGGTSTTVFSLNATDASNPAWVSSGAIDLSAFAGESIQVQFRFETVDGTANTFTGWFIDDVVVTGESPCGGPGNTAPNVTITAPVNGTTVNEGTSISFSGTATDAEDGTITSSLSWISNLDGSIGSGGSFSNVLSVGVHTVTASVTDSGGLSDSDQISVEVIVTPNTAPTVNITAPANGTTVTEGTSVTFSGTATDTEDGTLTGSLAWSSSLDGSIGSGGSFSISSLSIGTHTVTASVTDSGGLSGSDTVTVTVEEDVPPPGDDFIDFNDTPLVAYSNQDGSGSVLIEDGGATLFMEGNRWRRTSGAYNVTANTVIEFDFASDSEGEIHGIGFDENDTLTDQVRIFQLHGTQNWGGADHSFDNGYTGNGAFQSYTIPVGQFYTGSSMFLVFVNDKDSGTLNNTSRFRNVRIYEDTPPAGCVTTNFSTGSEGWTNSGTSTCSTGTFVSASPTGQTSGGVTTQVAGDHTGGGNAWFTATNISAGNADVDGGNCISESGTTSVTEDSNISLWYFHGQRDNGDDPGDDFFELEISTNGGSSWSSLVSIGDVTTNAAWTEVTTSVSAGSDVRFRLQVSDGAGPGDIVEGGIDDIEICPAN